MNYYAISGLVNGIVSTICGVVVYLQDKNEQKNRQYSYYCLGLAVWSYFYCLWHMAGNAQSALFFCRALMMGAIFLPILHYHHINTIFEFRSNKWLLNFLYVTTLIFAVANFTPFFIHHVEARSTFPFWPVPGPLFHPYLIIFIALLIFSIHQIWSYRRYASKYEKNQISWIIIATAIGWIGGATNFFLWYNIRIDPIFNINVSLYVAVSCLLFFRLGLLDVKSFFRELTIILVIYGSILILTFPLSLPFVKRQIDNGYDINIVLCGYAVFIGGILSIGPFLYAYIVKRNFWFKENVTTALIHELKSPIALITAASEQITKESHSAAPDMNKISARIQSIFNGITRLSTVIDNLLILAKLSTQNLRANLQWVHIQSLLKDEVSFLEAQCQLKNIKTEIHWGDFERIFTDPEKFKTIISNLLNNAVKYSSTGKITMAFYELPEELKVEITDTGKGISENHLQLIFEKFYQVDKNDQGVGIGLAITKAWVETLGGRIHVASEGIGKGTKFTILLPRKHSEPTIESQ